MKNSDLSLTSQVLEIIRTRVSSTHALRILRAIELHKKAIHIAHRLQRDDDQPYSVCRGLAVAADNGRVDRFLRKLHRRGFSHEVKI